MAATQKPKKPGPPLKENIKYEELSLGLLNINGLRNKTLEVRHIIAHHKLHAVALCETRLNTTVADSVVYIPGFSMWRKDRNDESDNIGGGVALYVQDHIETRLRPDLMKTKTNVKKPDVEIIWVEMKLPEGKPVLLGCCYRRKKGETKYLKHIEEMMKLIKENDEDKDIFLMGDFNIDWNSDEKKEADEAIKREGWKQIVDVPTRVAIDSETCIDHIYTKTSDHLKPKSIPTGCSDHNLVTVKILHPEVPQSEGQFRSNQFEIKTFQDDIQGKGKWGEVCRLTRPNESLQKALEKFTETFVQVTNYHAELKTQNIYMSLKLVDLEKKLSGRDEEKNKVMKVIFEYIKTKEEAQVAIATYLKKQKGKGENDAAENKPRQTSQKGKKEEDNPKQSCQTSPENKDLKSDFKGFKGFKGFQVQQKKKTNREESIFKRTESDSVTTWLDYICDHVVKVIDETEAKLIKHSVEKTNDSDELIQAPICDILNRCIDDKKFPDELKKIKLFPFSADSCIKIRQSSDADRVHIMLGYIFDVILYVQAKPFFIGNALNSEATLEEKLKQLNTDKLKKIKANKGVEAVLLDFTSSFDTISHEPLIKKLKELKESGFSDLDLTLIKSFLSDRKGSSGLPRGSCLAQLLRIIIINDLKGTLQPSAAVICNSYMMICGNKSKLDQIIEAVKNWDNQFNMSFEIRRKQFEPSELSAMFKILESMLRCHGDESNWIRAPGNTVMQNGDWKYDNVSKELELNFGREYKVEPEHVNNSQQKSGK